MYFVLTCAMRVLEIRQSTRIHYINAFLSPEVMPACPGVGQL